ncbi:hypothetical protein LP420_02190 [Massilia sp. B-10]|nr:hypothetical protein LP420_02190 [Massilia sp. B-10]
MGTRDSCGAAAGTAHGRLVDRVNGREPARKGGPLAPGQRLLTETRHELRIADLARVLEIGVAQRDAGKASAARRLRR